MVTLRIFDLDQGALAVNLRHLLDLLAPHYLLADWTISPVRSPKPGLEHFEATGHSREQLESLAEAGSTVSGSELAALAKETWQIIWGEFSGSLSNDGKHPWVIIRFIDSSFCEVTTSDVTVLEKIKSSFKDVRYAEPPAR